MLGKIAGSIIGARLADHADRSSTLGAAAGLVATWFVRRSPVGALVIGAAWVGHKLYTRSRERDAEAAKGGRRVGNEPLAPEVSHPSQVQPPSS